MVGQCIDLGKRQSKEREDNSHFCQVLALTQCCAVFLPMISLVKAQPLINTTNTQPSSPTHLPHPPTCERIPQQWVVWSKARITPPFCVWPHRVLHDLQLTHGVCGSVCVLDIFHQMLELLTVLGQQTPWGKEREQCKSRPHPLKLYFKGQGANLQRFLQNDLSTSLSVISAHKTTATTHSKSSISCRQVSNAGVHDKVEKQFSRGQKGLVAWNLK